MPRQRSSLLYTAEVPDSCRSLEFCWTLGISMGLYGSCKSPGPQLLLVFAGRGHCSRDIASVGSRDRSTDFHKPRENWRYRGGAGYTNSYNFHIVAAQCRISPLQAGRSTVRFTMRFICLHFQWTVIQSWSLHPLQVPRVPSDHRLWGDLQPWPSGTMPLHSV